MRNAAVAFTALTLACDVQTTALNGGPESGPTSYTPGDCEAVARVLSPASDGQSDFYFRDDIAFEISDSRDFVDINVHDENGTAVSGTTWVDTMMHTEGWSRIVFTPEAPLAPSTTHTATLTYCGGSPSVNFSTSALGTPMERPEEVDGRTFEIDLADASITKPSQVAQALLTLVDHSLLLQVDHVGSDGLRMSMGAADKMTGDQDTCLPTLNMAVEGDFTGPPTFAVGPVDVSFDLAGYTVTLFDAGAEATFGSDGSYFAGGRLSGTLDARDVVEALKGRDVLPVEDASAVCETITRVGLSCNPCSDGEVLCLDVEVESVQGALTDTWVEPVDDFDCHAGCVDACSNEDCETADQFEVCL